MADETKSPTSTLPKETTVENKDNEQKVEKVENGKRDLKEGEDKEKKEEVEEQPTKKPKIDDEKVENKPSTPIFGAQSATTKNFGFAAVNSGLTFGSFKENNNVFLKNEKTTEWVSPFSKTGIFGETPKKEKEEKEVNAPISTGEESEVTELSLKGKLYVFDPEEKKDWRERGVGVVKLNTTISNPSSRLIMRAEGSLRLILNANLFDGMFAELASEKSVRFTCADPEKKWLTYLIRTRNKDDALTLFNGIKKKVQIAAPIEEIKDREHPTKRKSLEIKKSLDEEEKVEDKKENENESENKNKNGSDKDDKKSDSDSDEAGDDE